MDDKILKVCKIDSINFASFALKQNVNYLGVHVLEKENIGQHRELVDFIKSKRGSPIIVTKIQDILSLYKLIELYKPKGIQFHYEINIDLVKQIRKKFPELLLFGVITNQTELFNFELVDESFDFIIYDTNYRGGTNQKNSYKHFENFPVSLKSKTLLAGGITVERIVELNNINSGGYDIQSYFRTKMGLSYKNLNDVCDLLKFPRKKKLSISLTDVLLKDIHKASSYYLYPNIEYHLDFSNGTLYSSFNTNCKSIEEKQQYLCQLPFSVHLFIHDIKELKERIQKLTEKYPLNLIRIFVQYFEGISKEMFSEHIAGIKIIPSIFYKNIDSYFSQSINSEILSIVVPKPENKIEIKKFITTFLSQQKYWQGKEIWFDRNLEFEYIELLKNKLGNDFNFIIGKGIIHDWNKINLIHEYLLK